MKGLIVTKKIAVWTASDGVTFDIKDEAEKHQAQLDLRGFFLAAVGDDANAAERIVRAILDDIDGFRKVLGPLVRKPRGPRKVATPAAPARVGVGGAAAAATPSKTKAA